MSLRDHIKQQRNATNKAPAAGEMQSVYAHDYTRKQRRGSSFVAAGVSSGDAEGILMQGGGNGLSAREAMLADRQRHMAQERELTLEQHKQRKAHPHEEVQQHRRQSWQDDQQQRIDTERNTLNLGRAATQKVSTLLCSTSCSLHAHKQHLGAWTSATRICPPPATRQRSLPRSRPGDCRRVSSRFFKGREIMVFYI